MNAVQRSMRSAGGPLRMILIGCIKVYRVALSGWLGGQCRFYPSCSRYAEEAIRVHGAVRGSSMALWRVLRCNPFGAGGIDQVHGKRGHESYDDVVRRASDQKARV
jgi:putative membrane protein insertion efficiency factor